MAYIVHGGEAGKKTPVTTYKREFASLREAMCHMNEIAAHFTYVWIWEGR